MVKLATLKNWKANRSAVGWGLSPLACRPGPQPSWAPGLSCCTLQGTNWHLRHLWVFHLQEENRSLTQRKQTHKANQRPMVARKHDSERRKGEFIWKCSVLSKCSLDLYQDTEKRSINYKSTFYGSWDKSPSWSLSTEMNSIHALSLVLKKRSKLILLTLVSSTTAFSLFID